MAAQASALPPELHPVQLVLAQPGRSILRRITVKLLRRGVRRSITALEKDIRGWIEQWNTNPKPYIWTRTADQILESLAAYGHRINEPFSSCGDLVVL